ncbi:DUF2637 domain-containing protein [Streptomyces racemochromogenes]|uniref:DUF2637 domain-containing protein n=1 Tax=Streptomyces racemochromogenes TaxID=67353 RepID=UPI0035E5454C
MTLVEPRPALDSPPAPDPRGLDFGPTDPGSATRTPASGTANPEDTQARIRISRALAVICLAGGPLLLGMGFYLSFNNLSRAAHERFEFAAGAQSILFAVCVDAAIVIFLGADLFFVSRNLRPYRWLRPAAHAMAGATIVLNSMAHGLTNWQASIPHSLPPFLAVVLVESGRDYLVQVAALERGAGRETIPWYRWAMQPVETTGIFRVMRKWEKTYDEVREQRRTLAIHEVWLTVREEIRAAEELESDEARQTAVKAAVDRLPTLLAPHGVSVEDALALPDVKAAEEQRREYEAAERAHQLAEEQADMEHEAQMKQLEREDAKAAREAERDRRRGVTAADIRGDVAAAQARATATERAAAAEAGALESQEAAEALAAAAEAARREAEAKKLEAEAKRDEAEARKREAEAKRDEAEAKREEAAKLAATEEAIASVEKLKQATAEARAAAAEANLRATEADEEAGLSRPKREARRLARLALAQYGGDVSAVDGVAEMFSVSPATATARRTEAAQLIAEGYRG